MAVPRTPDLPKWDPVDPAMDVLHCFGLAETEEVPLQVDTVGHIRGAVTEEVSALFFLISLFFLRIKTGRSQNYV